MYLTLIHNGGGGMCEAADARKVLGPFRTYGKANKAGQKFYEAVSPHNDYLRRETFHTVVEIPEPAIRMADAAEEYIQEWTIE